MNLKQKIGICYDGDETVDLLASATASELKVQEFSRQKKLK